MLQNVADSSPDAGETTRVFVPQLESVRGIAALTVLVFHEFVVVEPGWPAFETLPFPQALFNLVATTLFNGSGAVTVFFVLSGFVLGCNLDARRAITVAGYAEFCVRRFFRIMPAAFASIAFAVAVSYLFFGGRFGAGQIINYLLLRDVSINGPLWSILVELWASALYPFLLFASRSVGVTFNLLGLWFLVSLGLAETPIPFRYIAAFHLGILVSTIGLKIVQALPRAVQIALVFVAMLAFWSATQIHRFGYLNPKTAIMIEAFSAFYVVSFILYAKNDFANWLLNLPQVRRLGRVSYSLFLFHFPIHSAVTLTMLGKLGPTLKATYPLFQLVALPIVVVLSLIAAHLSYYAIERPFIKIGRHVGELIGATIREVPFRAPHLSDAVSLIALAAIAMVGAISIGAALRL
jgi:peptidoglycan/LPS O-acetylase OafA/YrhL